MHQTETNVGNNSGEITALFVRRPVLAIVVNLLIVVAGLAAIMGIPIRELPEVDNPVITLTATYSGASAETMDQEVTDVLESAASRVSGVKAISSTSSIGSSRVEVEFTDDIDLNVAAADLRNEVNQVENDLPDGADEPNIIKADNDEAPIMRLSVTSASMSIEDLSMLADQDISDRLRSVSGVADIELFGDRDKVFRVDIDQAQLAMRALTIADVSAALQDAALDIPAGDLSRNSQNLTIRAIGQIQTSEQFEQVILQDNTRLGDVAVVTLGPDMQSTSIRTDGQTGIGLNIIRQSGSNTLEISNGIKQAIEELQPLLPEDVIIAINSDDAIFIDGAITEVLKSLGLATLIVIAIIYLFLMNIRATLIPAITLPVALIGTVAGVWAAGFSMNIITLLAFVLATGMVVDDAIVVLENIVKKRSAGMGPRAAAVVGTKEVFFAVITTTATLAAVFIPLSFLPGNAGGLFREFGYTLAIAVTISSLVALSLCPMLASKLLTKDMAAERKHGGLIGRIAGAGRKSTKIYGAMLRFCIDAPIVVLAIATVFSLIAWTLYGVLPEEITPPEDRAVAIMRVTAPQGVSLEYTESQMQRIDQLMTPFKENGEIENTFLISGNGTETNRGVLVMRLAPWEDRERNQQQIVDDINTTISRVNSVRAFVISPNSLGIRGGGSGLQMAIVGSDYPELAELAKDLMSEMAGDSKFGRTEVSYESTKPQLLINIDRENADQIGVDISGLESALQAVLDGHDVVDVFVEGEAIGVKLMSTTHPVNDPIDLENIFLMTDDERIVPLSSIASLEESAVAPSLNREEKLRAVTITTELGDDIALREAMEKMEALAAPLLTSGTYLVPLSEAATLNETSSGLALVFGFAIVIVILVLAAQFESFVSSLIIVLTVPLGLACAVFALWFSGTSLNVYSQIGLVLLVGIIAKNGILIVEFANQLRDGGMSVRDAAEQAALQRLRPVMMTMISTVLGGLPLVLSSGAGSEARIALGWVIIGGLGLATLATLFVTPVVYRLLAGFSTSKAAEEKRLNDELSAGPATT